MNATAELLRMASLDLPPVSTEVATTLPVRAEVAFEVFADAGETPRWLSVVQSARVLSRTPDGRPLQVSFHANFERATLGYRVTYDYRPAELTVRWSTDDGSAIAQRCQCVSCQRELHYFCLIEFSCAVLPHWLRSPDILAAAMLEDWS